MSLADRLNKALEVRQLRPKIKLGISPRGVAGLQAIDGHRDSKGPPGDKGPIGMYPTLEAGIKAANTIEPDEFGTRIIVVEKVENFNQLPMTMGKYIVDDIQKINGGGYEVHLVEKNQR